MELIKTIFSKLITSIKESDKIDYDTVKFCFQHGESYPLGSDNTGILFIGRACNGWDSYSDDVDILFGQGEGSLFKRDSIREMITNPNPNYNPNRSAFWRVIGKLSSQVYGERWMDYIAWTNLYKIAPEEGNPDNVLGGLQYEHCINILDCEIIWLSPRVIVFFTGDESKGWITDDFIEVASGGIVPSFKKIKWDKHNLMYSKVNGRIIIVTEHPQGKAENPHIEALYRCILNKP